MWVLIAMYGVDVRVCPGSPGISFSSPHHHFPPINLAPQLWVLIAMFGVDERVCPGSHHFFLFFTPAQESSTLQQLFDQPIFRIMAYYSLFYSNSVPFSKICSYF